MNPEPTNPAPPKPLAEPDASASNYPRRIKRGLLRAWPLPEVPENGGKEARGSVLIVGGSAEMPGAVILAATAALRAGAGKLCIATAESVAQLVAQAVPEARVVGLRARGGVIQPDAAEKLNSLLQAADAILIGPGMQGPAEVSGFLQGLQLDGQTVVFDAEALVALGDTPRLLEPLAHKVLTPHAGEMAGFLDVPRPVVEGSPLDHCREAALRSGAVVALKGAETWIAAPDGSAWFSRAGNPGLGTSGSGDVLAGVLAGLLARGATPTQAAVWATFLHARAGEVLAARIGPLGYLARELPDVIPGLLANP